MFVVFLRNMLIKHYYVIGNTPLFENLALYGKVGEVKKGDSS
jgi:hypothetical protein